MKKRLGEGYVSADLFDPEAMVQMDVTDIQYPDASFDVIVCNHVLEHVDNDMKAMQEFHRTLKGDGWAILSVPIGANPTFEDPSITDPKERLRLFGQEDHVRNYGPDFADRLRAAGFKVDVFTVGELVGSDEAVRMGLTSGAGDIFFCTK
ncbi:MAG: class I SAM-dependent methyltransferase [Rhodothermales bacterium]